MTFYVQGLNSHEVMPLTYLFNQGAVEKTHGIVAKSRIDSAKHQDDDARHNPQTGIAMQSYQEVDQLQQSSPVLFASQVMRAPVISFKSTGLISEALKLFQTHQIRHIPVVTDSGIVEGIVSDRDILRYLSGVSENYEQHASSARGNDTISRLMKTQVLTASADTDVRYIARLFVERRVGAMPIVTDGSLAGIITRSDILSAVMRHFVLELWV